MPLSNKLDNALMKGNTNTSFENCTMNVMLPMNFFLVRTRSKTYVIRPALDIFSQLGKNKHL